MAPTVWTRIAASKPALVNCKFIRSADRVQRAGYVRLSVHFGAWTRLMLRLPPKHARNISTLDALNLGSKLISPASRVAATAEMSFDPGALSPIAVRPITISQGTRSDWYERSTPRCTNVYIRMRCKPSLAVQPDASNRPVLAKRDIELLWPWQPEAFSSAPFLFHSHSAAPRNCRRTRPAGSGTSLVHAQLCRRALKRTLIAVRCSYRVNDRNEHFVRITYY